MAGPEGSAGEQIRNREQRLLHGGHMKFELDVIASGSDWFDETTSHENDGSTCASHEASAAEEETSHETDATSSEG
jgi:hypothetical protein